MTGRHFLRTTRTAGGAALVLAISLAAASCAGPGQSGRARAADGADELVLQPAANAGPDPFTRSTADSSAAVPSPPPAAGPPDSPPPVRPGAQRSLEGSTAGLYGGTLDVASCDVEKQIAFLGRQGDKRRAFAGAVEVEEQDLPRYLRSLTAVVVRADTRVTNHGFVNGRATAYESVLQTGTAVLVDDRGLPRVRCACGNPLATPNALSSGARYSGTAWRGYRPERTVVVTPAPQPIVTIVIVSITGNIWIERPVDDGPDAGGDEALPEPPAPDPYDPPSPDGPDSPGPDDPGTDPGDDTGPPTAPAGLQAQATGPESVGLTWGASEDDTGVTGYQVVEEGSGDVVQETGGTATEAEVTGLEPDTGYAFTVRAVDAAGNVSPGSEPASATTEPAAAEEPEQPEQPEELPDAPDEDPADPPLEDPPGGEPPPGDPPVDEPPGEELEPQVPEEPGPQDGG